VEKHVFQFVELIVRYWLARVAQASCQLAVAVAVGATNWCLAMPNYMTCLPSGMCTGSSWSEAASHMQMGP